MVFVFGSNERGIHGGGAALVARQRYGAVLYIGFGRQGDSFAIPTCSKPTGEPGHEITLDTLAYYVECFLLYANKHVGEDFKVTRIGCGLAGWEDLQIAPLFANAPTNCLFDSKWESFLPGKRFWGTV